MGTAFTTNIYFTITGSPATGDKWTISSTGDTTFNIGTLGGGMGTAISFFRALDMNMSMSGLTNGLYFDIETYKQFQILDCDFDVVTGTAVLVASR